MDDDEALRLNTLHRFRKHSPRLLLEEYSHCEVPAGCGGAVLRWVDPRAGTPALIRTSVAAKITLWLDGAPLESGRVDLSAGTRVLALALAEIVPPKQSRLATMFGRGRPATLLLSIVRALGRDTENHNAIVMLSSRATSAWRVTGETPAPSWTAPEFDDSSWSVPERGELDPEDRNQWRAERLQSHGAVPLALPPKQAWMRVRFQVAELHTQERE
jgi:hypothetical protein